jgi:hypothetical protein
MKKKIRYGEVKVEVREDTGEVNEIHVDGCKSRLKGIMARDCKS